MRAAGQGANGAATPAGAAVARRSKSNGGAGFPGAARRVEGALPAEPGSAAQSPSPRRGVDRVRLDLWESPQMRVGSGGASSMPPQQRNSIEINAPGEWKP